MRSSSYQNISKEKKPVLDEIIKNQKETRKRSRSSNAHITKQQIIKARKRSKSSKLVAKDPGAHHREDRCAVCAKDPCEEACEEEDAQEF